MRCYTMHAWLFFVPPNKEKFFAVWKREPHLGVVEPGTIEMLAYLTALLDNMISNRETSSQK